MDRKVWAFVNWGFLLVVSLVLVWLIWGPSQTEERVGEDFFAPSGNCIDVVALEELKYQACYDAYSETIFLKVTRGKANYKIDKMSVSFVDINSQSYDLEGVPDAGENGAYKILAKKNPESIDVRLEISQDFSGSVCSGGSVFVDYCPTGTGGSGVGVSISPIEGVEVKDFVEVQDFQDFESDVVVMDLVEKEKIWGSKCKSSWKCGEWESCVEGVQRRDCKDSNKCVISTDSPVSSQRCDGGCDENWECEWSSCLNGVSSPTCEDLNDCGTSYDIPKELSCRASQKCVPYVVCGNWTSCEVDYDFIDLVGVDGVAKIGGVKTRVCVDEEGCVPVQKEESVCSVSVDIYTKKFERCGQEYVGVYGALDDGVLAVLKEGRGSLNIYFDDQAGIYCDYCFDGKKNGDEEGVDCGGSCERCESENSLSTRKWWDFFNIFG